MSHFLRSLFILSLVLVNISFSTQHNKTGGTQVRALSLDKGGHKAVIANTLGDRLQQDSWPAIYSQELINTPGHREETIADFSEKMLSDGRIQDVLNNTLSAMDMNMLPAAKPGHLAQEVLTYLQKTPPMSSDQDASKNGVIKVGDNIQTEADKYRVVYKGDAGPGLGKKIVFIASDHEYRSEESLPALARILAKRYGFTCTVVWALDEKGYILPGSSDIKGLEVLDNANLMVIFTRFANFPDAEMQHIDDYLKRGGPVMGFRTATHAFNIKNNPKWQHYDYDYKGPMKEWKDGFGELVLGETWVGHYGTNHKQASKLVIEDAQKDHPIMIGVKDAWAQSGGYNAYPENTGSTVLARGQVLNGMTPDAAPDTSKKLLPVAWVRNYTYPSGASGRAFATTHGASEDLLSTGFRRMVINAAFWTLGMESQIKADNNIDFVGPYKPTTFNFSGYKANVKPADLAGWKSLIMPGEVVKPVK